LAPCWCLLDIDDIKFEYWSKADWSIFFKQLSLVPNTCFLVANLYEGIEIPDQYKYMVDLYKHYNDKNCTKLGILIEAARMCEGVFSTNTISKSVADIYKIKHVTLNYDINPNVLATNIKTQITNNFSDILLKKQVSNNEEERLRLIDLNFSKSMGSSHPSNEQYRLASESKKKALPFAPKSRVFGR
jgi:hypothetical protein